MKRFFNQIRRGVLWTIAAGFLWCALQSPAAAFDTPGIECEVLLQKGSEPLFDLGAKVPLIIVVRNRETRPVFTERGFSQTGLQDALMVTGPDGRRYSIRAADTGHRMPPPFFLNDKAFGMAEALPAGWSRSAEISDLRELVPVMKTVPGWYTIEAQQAFVRYTATADVSGLGLLAQLENPENWHGALVSNKLQVYIKPAAGGRPEILVEDSSSDPAEPLFQVPVRVFRRADIPANSSLAASWDSIAPVLAGTTDSEGIARWSSKEPCLVKADYAVIARYGDRFGEASLPAGADAWTPGTCSGILRQIVSFAALPPVQQVITVKGSAYNYPQPPYRGTVSFDVTNAGGTASGQVKYYYTRTRMNFVSTGITEIAASGGSAKIKGTGTVNGKGGYSFETDVVDGSPDQFGIVIRDAGGSTLFSTTLLSINGGSLSITIE